MMAVEDPVYTSIYNIYRRFINIPVLSRMARNMPARPVSERLGELEAKRVLNDARWAALMSATAAGHARDGDYTNAFTVLGNLVRELSKYDTQGG